MRRKGEELRDDRLTVWDGDVDGYFDIPKDFNYDNDVWVFFFTIYPAEPLASIFACKREALANYTPDKIGWLVDLRRKD